MSDNQRKISSFFGLGAKKKAAAPAVAPNQVGATAKGSPSASAGTGNSGGSSASPSRKRPADATEGAAGEQPAAKKKATEQQTTAPPGDPKVIAAILESRVNQFTNKYIETIAAEGGAKAEGKEEPQVVAGAGAAAGGGAGSDQDAGTAKPLDTGGVRAVRHWNFGGFVFSSFFFLPPFSLSPFASFPPNGLRMFSGWMFEGADQDPCWLGSTHIYTEHDTYRKTPFHGREREYVCCFTRVCCRL